ncbi:hypothetical protein RP20_CCG021631 [Aedes albopictus]|nr:hypothetical protein RP20_CCG021631 [Aedes albopictus]
MKISIDRDDKTKKKVSQEREQVRNLGAIPKRLDIAGSVEKRNAKEQEKSKKNERKLGKTKRINKKSSSEDESSSLDSLSSLLSSESSSESESRNFSVRSEDLGRDRDYRGQNYRLDKWGIQFSGDIHGMDVLDFVFQVNELMQAERIPNDRFLDHAYILFSGEARRWYFTYKKKYRTWDKFSKQLKIRFGDPNKDRKILQDIKDRKQRKLRA